MDEFNSILEMLLTEVFIISDKKYQRRVWITGEGPECDDFDETVCRYANVADRVMQSEEAANLDKKMKILKKFHEEFKKFWIKNDLPQLFIDTPEWTRITEMAQEVLDLFDYKKPV